MGGPPRTAASFYSANMCILIAIYLHLSVILTIGLTLLTYVKTLRNLKKLSKTLSTSSQDTKEQRLSHTEKMVTRERNITEAFLYMLFAFMATHIPGIIMAYILNICLDCSCTFRHVLRDLVAKFISANSAVYPVICFRQMKEIGKLVKQALVCCRKINYKINDNNQEISRNPCRNEARKT